MIIDGEEVAEKVRNSVEENVRAMDDTPKLVAVLMSDDPASETYVEMKKRDCEQVGIESEVHEIDPDAPADKLFNLIDELNADNTVDGVLVQSP
ncbi:MAG: tetrahydrofolate dehydrogenase/cyclohydrolase catalytic domain-containing protein, partial [Halobacteria archaeon]|nr:tetrahydrofolate dehydrogenase/cyclohydrolase catalytic domain-containing protein [Halobacteria archaeon]